MTDNQQSPIPELLIPTTMITAPSEHDLLKALIFELVKNLNGGDLAKTTRIAFANWEDAFHKTEAALKKANETVQKKIEEGRSLRRQIVRTAFADTHRLRIEGGEIHKWDEVLTIETGNGPVDWKLADEIVDREEEFKVDAATTRASLNERYVGFEYDKHLRTSDGLGTRIIRCQYVHA